MAISREQKKRGSAGGAFFFLHTKVRKSLKIELRCLCLLLILYLVIRCNEVMMLLAFIGKLGCINLGPLNLKPQNLWIIARSRKQNKTKQWGDDAIGIYWQTWLHVWLDPRPAPPSVSNWLQVEEEKYHQFDILVKYVASTRKRAVMKVSPVPGPTAVRVHNSTGDSCLIIPWTHILSKNIFYSVRLTKSLPNIYRYF